MNLARTFEMASIGSALHVANRFVWLPQEERARLMSGGENEDGVDLFEAWLEDQSRPIAMAIGWDADSDEGNDWRDSLHGTVREILHVVGMHP